ncbi:MAG: hypothetical protein CM1200mP41_35760 [Gammaproteobacteria bacterium]|nr:MAG: hypothetical protein CM1200mP41_35760 [Gammaproteobacteria bacterium]
MTSFNARRANAQRRLPVLVGGVVTTRIAVSGVSGRMGRTLVEAIDMDSNSVLVHAFEQPGCDQIGMDAGAVAGLTRTQCCGSRFYRWSNV